MDGKNFLKDLKMEEKVRQEEFIKRKLRQKLEDIEAIKRDIVAFERKLKELTNELKEREKKMKRYEKMTIKELLKEFNYEDDPIESLVNFTRITWRLI